MSTPTATHDMIDVLVHDHREVEQLFQELENPATDTERREQLVTVAIAELVRHSVAEEEYLYPATREVLSDGNQIADREVQDHSRAEEAMKRLERMRPDESDYDPVMRSLMSEIREHITDEEDNLFPRLREECTNEQLVDLGGKIERAKQMAPTRPHPSAPDQPPANKMVAPGAGLVDRLRDAMSNRPTSPDQVQ